MPTPQFRAVVITDYRPQLQTAGYQHLPEGVQYIAWGHETCPSTGRAHLQAFAYGQKMSIKKWADLFGNSHIEPMLGSFRSNDLYCSKQSSLKEIGERPMHNGERRTLLDATDAVLRQPNVAPVEMAIDDPSFAPIYVQYGRGLERLSHAALNRVLRQRTHAPEVIHVFGPPGSGKTRYVHDLEQELYDVPASDDYKWRDGYHGHDAVLFDNVEAISYANRGRFLKDIDRYFIQVPVKGGFVGWRPKRIYVTTLTSPACFARQFQDPQEYLRRVTSVVDLSTINETVMIENKDA